MFAPDRVLLDPEPHLGQRDLSGLDWEASWDCTSTATAGEDWDVPAGVDLDVELRALLDSVRRIEPGASAQSEPVEAEDAGLIAVLAELAERSDAALAAESTEVAVAPLTGWSDAAIVAEAARLERLTRWATARGYELVQELALRRPDPSGDPDEVGLSAYAVDEVAVAVGISRWGGVPPGRRGRRPHPPPTPSCCSRSRQAAWPSRWCSGCWTPPRSSTPTGAPPWSSAS
jgi:hypothetical protein